MDKGRHLGYCSLIGVKGSSSEKRKKKMATKYQGEDVITLVTEILVSDVIDVKNAKAISILQDIIDSAKLSIANRHYKTVEKDLLSKGKKIANKNEVIKVIVNELNFSQDEMVKAIATCYGVKL